MGIKVSVHTDGMDAVRAAIAKACTRAEHVLAEQMEKDTQPFVPALTGSHSAHEWLTTRLSISDRMHDFCTTAK